MQMKNFERITKPLMWAMALLLASLAAGCNQGSGPILGGGGLGIPAPVVDTTAPRIIATGVLNGATGLATNRSSTVTFSEPMKSATLTSASPSTAAGTTFTVCSTATQGSACVTPVAGVVTYTGTTATFKPDAVLAVNTWYKSTISTAATDLAGNALISGTVPNPWSWQTGALADTTPPTVTVTNPADVATNVLVSTSINATFSEPIDQTTIITANFTVVETVSLTNVAGSLAYDSLNNIATFTPLNPLTAGMQYTATVTNGIKDLAGNALVVPALAPPNNPWKFTTALSAVPPPPLAVNLRGAASFGIASRAGMTSTGVTVVNGDVALYPLAGCTDSTGNAGASQTCLVKTYSSPTGLTVNGSIYWAGDPFDNGGTANSVTNDLNIAWTEAKNKVDTFAPGSIAGEQLAGKILIPGVYHEANLGLSAGGLVQLDAQNNANAIFIFKIDSTFVDSGTTLLPSEVRLINGAQARNVWFVTGAALTIGHGTKWNGNILAGGTATILDGSTVMGRVLAGAAGAGAITLTGAASPSVTTISVPQ
jgi:hypothetical protein